MLKRHRMACLYPKKVTDLTISLLEEGRFYGNFVPYIPINGFPGTQHLPLGALCYLLKTLSIQSWAFQTALAVWVSPSPGVPYRIKKFLTLQP